MHAIDELGIAVQARRCQMGLTQARVATLSGLTRQTVNQIEKGTVQDLSLNRAERLADVLGLAVRVGDPHASQKEPGSARMSALVRAARLASVSFRASLAPTQLRKILQDGHASPADAVYVHVLLDEAPVSLLAALAQQLHHEASMSLETAWKHFRGLARQVMSKRELWQ